MEKEHIGFEIRTLSNLLHRKINQMVAEEEEREVVQRDIEKEFSIRRSTASHMLTLMENNGYVRRVPVPQDARLKRIILTEKGSQAQKRMVDRLRRFEHMLRGGITDEETEFFLDIVRRIGENIQ